MSKHTWLTKPTQAKADSLKDYFFRATNAGASLHQARVFAGYAVEAVAQKGASNPSFAGSRFHVRDTAQEILDGCVRTKWRITRAKNAPNYLKCFQDHTRFWTGPIAASLKMETDTPWQALADLLRESGRDEEADQLTQLCGD